jgi:hypothetical protein
MWYKTVEHKEGRYTDKSGKTYILVQCHKAMDKEGRKNKELGLTEFATLEDCLKEWELTKVEREVKRPEQH